MRTTLLAGCLMLFVAMVYGKDGRSYYDDAMMAGVREKIAKYDWAKAQVPAAEANCEWYMDMSDQELWDLVPPPQQLRAINVCHGVGCPFCGEEIIRKAGHYPWKMSREQPFKVTCPVCNRTFPENDFEPWNTAGKDGQPESGDRIIDKGIGWVDKDGNRYYFVAYYMFWQRWNRDILGGMRSLGEAYLLSGNPVYGHKAAILMCKLAGEYERFDYGTQCYHEGIWNVRGRISDYIWTTGNDSTVALAYDAIYPVFDEDPQLLAFLKEKGIDNPRDHIELNMLKIMANDIYTGYAAGNMGAHQRTMCYLALAMDNDDPERGLTTEQAREWLMSGEGRIEDLLWNGFWRDGMGGESSPSYSSGWCYKFYQLAELLPKLGIEIWDNPKLRAMADIGLEMAVTGKFCPCIGDCGGVQGSGAVAWHASLQGPAFTHYGEAKYAKALAQINATSRNLWEDYFDEAAVAAVVEKEGKALDWKTRNIGGYGLAILESGKGEHRRGASMYYGAATGGHGHRDRLTLGLFAYGYPLFPEMGYPTPFRTPKRGLWTSNTISHYCVLIDQVPHRTADAGDLNTLAASPEVQLMDASAEIAYTGMASLYRRTAALIDISEQDSYLLDIFRVRGGSEHHWSYHGPAHFSDFSVSGGQPGPVQEGTLAGEDIPYAGEIPAAMSKTGLALPLLKAEGLITEGDYGETSKTGWAAYGKGFLTRCQGAEIKIKTPEIAAGKVKVFMHIYDYNKGTNQLDISLGGVTKTFLCAPTGTVGNYWASEIYELPEAVSQVALNAKAVGQTYIQIDSIVITSDLRGKEPIVQDIRSSGFNYLFNIRRMQPQGMWSATWRKPDEDVAMTVTMPAGCVAEVILGDGIPELQPGNPDTIQYTLGHNQLPEAQAQQGEELFRNYVAVVEPHTGKAKVTAVEHLQGEGGSPETVGLAVRRAGATDFVHSSLSAEQRCTWQAAGKPLVVAAEFALLTLDDQGIKRVVVINGTLLEYGDFALHPAASPAGKVLSVDLANNAITIDTALAAPEACQDTVAILGNELQRTSYTIRRAEVADQATTLDFGHVLLTIGMGAVAAADEAAKTITADRPLSGYGRIDGGRHAGRWLYNEDKSKGFRIGSIRGQTFTLEDVEGSLEDIFTDADGDGRRLYWISEVGPGDTYRIPTTTYYARDSRTD